MSDTQEILETVHAMHRHSNALTARLFALEVLTDSILGAVGRSLPPLTDVIQDHLFGLADVREEEMPEELRAQFRAHISDAARKIQAMK